MKYHLTILLITAILHVTGCPYGGTNSDSSAVHQISIMTYNVKLLPRGAVFLHHHPVKRALLIPDKVITESPDVVVFQEAFDGKSVRILRKKLKSVYPYCMGWQNRRVVTYKRAGGVLMFCKYPMHELESIGYSQCKGADCLGHKGAMLVEVEHPAHKFQLLGTHMQAGGNKDLKESQYEEAAALLKRHHVEGMPQFIAGDFNTHKGDTTLYPKLVAALNAMDGPVNDEEKVLNDPSMNDMRENSKPNHKKKGVIDYVFIKENGVKIKSEERYARKFEQRWSNKHKDLSDHDAVILKVSL